MRVFASISGKRAWYRMSEGKNIKEVSDEYLKTFN